jgi:adenosyl cobinamide kinase/adenosyl cobinamide phosphate guanylyltransferase
MKDMRVNVMLSQATLGHYLKMLLHNVDIKVSGDVSAEIDELLKSALEPIIEHIEALEKPDPIVVTDEVGKQMSYHLLDCILDALNDGHSYLVETTGDDWSDKRFREAIIVALSHALQEFKEKGTVAGGRP